MIDIVKAGTREVLQEIIVEEQDEDVSSLSGSPSKKQKTQSRSHHIALKATEALKKNGTFKTSNIKIRRLHKEAVATGVKSFAETTTSSSHTSMTATHVQPSPTPKQVNYHRSKINSMKNDEEGCYILSLKEGTTMYLLGRKSFQKICNELNKKYELHGKRKLNNMMLSNGK